MNLSIKKLRGKIKEKLWLLRPIGLFAIIGLLIFNFVSREIYATDQINALRRYKPILKIEMSIISDAGVNNVTLNDNGLLDSINNAFRVAEDNNIEIGKVFETQADIKVYKENHVIILSIRNSIYSGWTIEIGGKIFTNEYLFSIVRRYAK